MGRNRSDRAALVRGKHVNLRSMGWIWHIRGRLVLPPGQSGDEAFDRLDPLFDEPGTSHKRESGTLIFQKKDQAAQDKMSVFDSGVLQVEKGAAGLVLRYDLVSRALLFCFLAPLLFLTFAMFIQVTAKYQKPDDPAKEAAEKKKEESKEIYVPLNPIDKALGAPEPEKPKKDKTDVEDEDKKKGSSPVTAYVFASLFAVLYVVGRILEQQLIRSVFRKSLFGEAAAGSESLLARMATASRRLIRLTR